MLPGRPARIGGVLVSPNCRRLVRMVVIERALHPAASAIWDVVSDLLKIISRINSLIKEGIFGVILCVAGNVEGEVVGFNYICLVGRLRTESVQRIIHDLGVSVLSGNLHFYSDEQG